MWFAHAYGPEKLSNKSGFHGYVILFGSWNVFLKHWLHAMNKIVDYISPSNTCMSDALKLQFTVFQASLILQKRFPDTVSC